jgi:cyclic di-GMP phosphodiesterase Gmr
MCFEITESEWMQEQEGFGLLESYGADLVIDDFGTGYSSLSRLAHMPCRGLKLDREFIQGIDESPQNEALVQAVVQMGRALDLTVVAEGVETRAELEVLRKAGVEYAQGYYFARPMPFQALVEQHATHEV